MVKAINVILFCGINHRQIRQFLLEAVNEYGDLLYFCNVRWLSQGAMLDRVYVLRNEIVTFLESKTMTTAEFRNQQWVSKLAFLVDLVNYLKK